MQLRPIEEQVVVILGASSGIGRGATLAFAERGARVVGAARGQEDLDSLAAEIRTNGGTIVTIAADVADRSQVVAVAERAVAEFGRIDTWVNVAAVSLYATFEQTTEEEFRRVVDVTLLGSVNGAAVALPHLRRAGGGALIQISSVEAKRAFPLQSAYACAKHGVHGFIEALRVELQHESVPISVTEILPASINTPFFEKARTKLGVKPKGAPPLYQPRLVVDAILHAAEHPVREIAVGEAAGAILLGQRLAPAVLDALLVRGGFDSQRTDEPKGEEAPDNMFQSLPGHDRVEGSAGPEAMKTSLYTTLQTRPAARAGLAAGILLGAAALLRRGQRVA